MSKQPSEQTKFDPEEMQRRVDKMKAEGRLPTPEAWGQMLEMVRPEYQMAISQIGSPKGHPAAARKVN